MPVRVVQPKLAGRPHIGGPPTDVFELDAALEDGMDHIRGIRGPDIVRNGARRTRYGAIAAAMPVEGGTLVLTAGHVVLPQHDGTIARRFVTDPRRRPVQARFTSVSGDEYLGSVEEGELGDDRDWGLVFFRDLTIRQANIFRLHEVARLPLRCAVSELAPGHSVYQYPSPWPVRGL